MAKKPKKLRRMTKAAEAAYLKSPFHCPYCKSTNIDADAPDAQEHAIYVTCMCGDCRRTWVDRYNITSVDDGDEHAEEPMEELYKHLDNLEMVAERLKTNPDKDARKEAKVIERLVGYIRKAADLED